MQSSAAYDSILFQITHPLLASRHRRISRHVKFDGMRPFLGTTRISAISRESPTPPLTPYPAILLFKANLLRHYSTRFAPSPPSNSIPPSLNPSKQLTKMTLASRPCHECVTSREARSARIELGKFRVSCGVIEVAMATWFLVK
jgi:hypothetical protein